MKRFKYQLRKNDEGTINSEIIEKILDEKLEDFGKLESMKTKNPVYYKDDFVIKIEDNCVAKIYGENKKFVSEKVSNIEKMTGINFHKSSSASYFSL